jgi:hypothetical protein
MSALLNHEVIMGKAKKKKKEEEEQLYQQLHLISTVNSSCIYYLRQGRTNSRVQVATASEFFTLALDICRSSE